MICPYCFKSILLTKKRKLRVHGYRINYTSGQRKACHGSGLPADEAFIAFIRTTLGFGIGGLVGHHFPPEGITK